MTLVEQLTAAMDERRVGRYLEQIDAAKVIRGTLHKCVKVKADNGAPGKARITFQAPNEDEPEEIETEWLSDPVAYHIASVARDNLGKQVTMWKHNAPDPAGKVSQGFRRIVWIEA